MLLQRLCRRAAPILFACLIGTNASFVAAQPHTPGTSQLGGWVYIDRNNDGDIAFSNEPSPEFVIGGVSISLYSQAGPESLVATTQTDAFGRYFFNNLAPGTYGLKQTQPVQYVDGLDTIGQMLALTNSGVPGGASVGSMLNDAFNNIVLPANVRGDFFNFGELGLAPGFISKRFLLGSAPELPTGMIPEPATATMVIVALLTGLVPRRRRRD